MISETTFFGLPLRTPAQRRALVVLYYAALLCMASVGIVRNKSLPSALLTQTFILGGLLGGIRGGGPVKAYTERSLLGGNQDTRPLVLGLNAAMSRAMGSRYWTPLDERETEQRDRAHFCASRLLLGAFVIVALGAVIASWFAPARLEHEAPMILWALFVLAVSLPQAVLLWTEPPAPSGE